MNPRRVRKGERIRAADHNDLVALAEQGAIGIGPLKGQQDANGFVPRIAIRTTVSAGHAFRVALEEDGDKLLVTFTPAHVAGKMPEIEGKALDEIDDTGNFPRLEVPEAAWIKRGAGERALIMFRYELDRVDFTVAKVVPVAVATRPPRAPWTWHKLVAIAVRQGGQVRLFPQMFLPQGFLAADTNSAGGFRPLPYAEP